MSIYEQNQEDKQNKLNEMKREASINGDAVTFNAINLYERNGKDATLLVKEIKRLYDLNRALEEENRRLYKSSVSLRGGFHL